MPFAFESLKAYQRAVEMAELAEEIRRASRMRVSRNLLDQFSRAALSISLNLAEGNGRWHKADKKQYFWIARGSAFECVPVLEILRRTQVINEEKFRQCYECLEEISKTVSGMIKAVEKQSEIL